MASVASSENRGVKFCEVANYSPNRLVEISEIQPAPFIKATVDKKNSYESKRAAL